MGTEWKNLRSLMTSESSYQHGYWECPPLKHFFVIEKRDFMCLSHWCLTFMLYAKINLQQFIVHSFKKYVICYIFPQTPPKWLLISLEIQSKALSIKKPQILSLTFSSFTLIQVSYEYTSHTPTSGPLHIMSFAWNVLPPDIHVAHLFHLLFDKMSTYQRGLAGNCFYFLNCNHSLSLSILLFCFTYLHSAYYQMTYYQFTCLFTDYFLCYGKLRKAKNFTNLITTVSSVSRTLIIC